MPYLSTVMQKIKPKLSTYISYLATEMQRKILHCKKRYSR